MPEKVSGTLSLFRAWTPISCDFLPHRLVSETPEELYRWGKHCLGVKKFACLFVFMVVSVCMFVCVFLSVVVRICMHMLHMFLEPVEGRAKGGGRGDG